MAPESLRARYSRREAAPILAYRFDGAAIKEIDIVLDQARLARLELSRIR